MDRGRNCPAIGAKPMPLARSRVLGHYRGSSGDSSVPNSDIGVDYHLQVIHHCEQRLLMLESSRTWIRTAEEESFRNSCRSRLCRSCEEALVLAGRKTAYCIGSVNRWVQLSSHHGCKHQEECLFTTCTTGLDSCSPLDPLSLLTLRPAKASPVVPVC